VESFFDRLNALGSDSRALNGLKVVSIGPATAAALRQRGVVADVCPEVYTGAGIVSTLGKMDIDGDRFLLPRTDIADRELAEGILGLGGRVHEVTVYKTAPARTLAGVTDALASGEIDIMTFASSSTVSNLIGALGNQTAALRDVKVACIGPKTAETARAAGLKVDIMAREHTIPGLVQAIEEYYRGANSGGHV
jgi:uroporphyrinogen III methyltransferase/synthase